MNRGNMEIVIQCSNVSKSFQMGLEALNVLNNVSLEIKKGEFVSIMGPSGSGKSTLLYLIGGLDKPTQGSIKINNQELSSLKDRDVSIMRRRNLGFVFQFYNLIPNLNVEENILLPILLDGHNPKKYQKQLDEILEIVGLSDRRKHTPMELSGGQQQRVAIARALINKPEIILADEPTGNLDSKTGSEIMDLFAKINKENNITIVIVTHSLDSAQYSNRIINVKDGNIIETENM